MCPMTMGIQLRLLFRYFDLFLLSIHTHIQAIIRLGIIHIILTLTIPIVITIIGEILSDIKETVLAGLHAGPVSLVFKKADGSERTMKCTLAPSLLPPLPLNEGQAERAARKKNPDVCPVRDLDKAAWRSFRWDSLIVMSVEKQVSDHD